MLLVAVAAPASGATRLGRRVLTMGMRGHDVRVLQHDLTELGIKTRVNGLFDRVTRAHIRTFQREHHLAVDGIVGRHTLHALRQALAARLRAIKAAASAQTDTGGVSTGGTTTTTSGTSTGGTSTGGTTTSGTSTGGTTGTDSTTSSGGSTASATSTSTSCSLPTDNTGQVGLPTTSAPCSTVPKLHLNAHGLVVIPNNIPLRMKRALQAANRIAHRVYLYGGGHSGWGGQRGYDCSGSVSYVLHAAGLMVRSQGDRWKEPFDSTQFERFGVHGRSTRGWITIYTNAGHVFLKIANLYYDTAAQGGRRHGSRWSTHRVSPLHGFTVRHPNGW